MKRTTVNLTPATEQQVEKLKAAGYGQFTEIVRIAIDRMAQQETPLARAYFDDDSTVKITAARAVAARGGSEYGYHVIVSTRKGEALLSEHWNVTESEAQELIPTLIGKTVSVFEG